MDLYAIETESHNDNTITHFTRWGKQLEGNSGRWQGMCGRYVTGVVWEHGTVDGPRCKNCASKQLQLQKRGV